jgi:hypothetical protein
MDLWLFGSGTILRGASSLDGRGGELRSGLITCGWIERSWSGMRRELGIVEVESDEACLLTPYSDMLCASLLGATLLASSEVSAAPSIISRNGVSGGTPFSTLRTRVGVGKVEF